MFPKVTKVVEHQQHRAGQRPPMPKSCPNAAAILFARKAKPTIAASTPIARQLRESILHFAARSVMNIEAWAMSP